MLNESYINELIKKYAATDNGRKSIKEKTGIDYDPNKDRGISPEGALNFAEKMKICLFKQIRLHIKSIALDDIIIESPVTDAKGETTISLSFRQGSVFRPSLQPSKYPEGINNIVLHFTHGWKAKGYAYGQWHNEQVPSRQIRNGSSFMQDAVNEFNSKTKGVATAELSSKYK